MHIGAKAYIIQCKMVCVQVDCSLVSDQSGGEESVWTDGAFSICSTTPHKQIHVCRRKEKRRRL